MKQVKIFSAANVGQHEATFRVEHAINAWLAANPLISGLKLHPTHAETGGECSTTVYTILVEYTTPERALGNRRERYD